MSVVQIVFSPTGGTQRVADIVCDELAGRHGGRGAVVDLSDPDVDGSAAVLGASDVAVFAAPSFGGRVPAPASERMARLDGKGAPCVLVCVYGNRAYEDTLVEMEDVAEAAGFKVVAAIAAIAEHSMLHQYATGRPDEGDRDRLAAFARRIDEKLAGESALSAPEGVPGDRPYKKLGGGMVPRATRKCTACGACARKCPVRAIDAADPTRVDEDACIGCMRCVAVCPQGARSVNGAMLAAAGLALKKACSIRHEPELYL